MSRAIPSLFILIGATLLLAACAAIPEQQKLDLLDGTLRSYEKAIRWGKFETANSFRKGGARQSLPTDFAALAEIRVSSYEVMERTVAPDKSQAVQTVTIKYYHSDHPVERTVMDRQEWRYDALKRAWHLNGDLPAFQ